MIYNSGIWYGENYVLIDNDSGTLGGWNGVTISIRNMFDGDAETSNGNPTMWHSEEASYGKVQTLQFTFNQPINFNRLKMKKRRIINNREDDQAKQEEYKNVCVVLDDDITNKLCTDTPNGGFNGVSNPDRDSITWTKDSFANLLSS